MLETEALSSSYFRNLSPIKWFDIDDVNARICLVFEIEIGMNEFNHRIYFYRYFSSSGKGLKIQANWELVVMCVDYKPVDVEIDDMIQDISRCCLSSDNLRCSNSFMV